MNKPIRLTLAASVLAAGTAISATVVTPASVTSTIAGDAGSSADWLLTDNGGFGEDSLQRPVGTSVTLPTGTDLTDALATVAARSGGAHAESWTRGTNEGNPVFVFDLSSNTDINSIILWQYGNNGGPGTTDGGNSTRDFSLIFHTAAEGSTFSFLADAGTEAPEFAGVMDAISGNDPIDNVAQNFDFSGIENARYVALRIDTNYLGQPGITNGGDRYGLGEVRFAIPEPSTALLGGLGLLALLRRRR